MNHVSMTAFADEMMKIGGVISSGLNAAKSVGGFLARKAGPLGLVGAGASAIGGASQAAKTFQNTNAGFKPATGAQMMAGAPPPPPG